eukprot:CAMPEP_0170453094 /NCGR_PEP_ID=MMETSP0123-20130129/1785_1 /TAXON_ID=182087 /ORGANISM="Favella ehrenbergii, Strain Fehren 1" /LENGTH=42 /DNA_ID= /DNA_START= /DNA_END= /DNA_ORIENTATION=
MAALNPDQIRAKLDKMKNVLGKGLIVDSERLEHKMMGVGAFK